MTRTGLVSANAAAPIIRICAKRGPYCEAQVRVQIGGSCARRWRPVVTAAACGQPAVTGWPGRAGGLRCRVQVYRRC